MSHVRNGATTLQFTWRPGTHAGAPVARVPARSLTLLPTVWHLQCRLRAHAAGDAVLAGRSRSRTTREVRKCVCFSAPCSSFTQENTRIQSYCNSATGACTVNGVQLFRQRSHCDKTPIVVKIFGKRWCGSALPSRRLPRHCTTGLNVPQAHVESHLIHDNHATPSMPRNTRKCNH